MRLSLAAAVVIAGFCLLLAGLAESATVAVSWAHPITNTDGSALPVSAITKTTVVYGTTSSMTNSKVVTGTATSTTLDLAPGTWYVAAKTTRSSLMAHVAQPLPDLFLWEPHARGPSFSSIAIAATDAFHVKQ